MIWLWYNSNFRGRENQKSILIQIETYLGIWILEEIKLKISLLVQSIAIGLIIGRMWMLKAKTLQDRLKDSSYLWLKSYRFATYLVQDQVQTRGGGAQAP